MSYKAVKIIDGRAIRVDPRNDAEGIPDERVDVHDKTTRAYDAYLELRDTASWMHAELTDQLRHFELTMLEFRVMQVIYRKPLYLEEMSRRLNSEKANVAKVIKLLRMAGWVRSRRRRLPSRAAGPRAAANENGGRGLATGKKREDAGDDERVDGGWPGAIQNDPCEAREAVEGIYARARWTRAIDLDATVHEIAAGEYFEICAGVEVVGAR